ncbi:MAG: short-chain dehydrogenase, partial [Planktomarina sp.]
MDATSDIARAVAHRFAQQDYALRLAARHSERLEDDQADLTLRHGAAVSLHKIDVLDTDSHAAFVDTLPALPDVTICA